MSKMVTYDMEHDQWSHLFVPGHLVSPQGHPSIHGEIVGYGDEWVVVDWWDNKMPRDIFRGDRMNLLRLEGTLAKAVNALRNELNKRGIR